MIEQKEAQSEMREEQIAALNEKRRRAMVGYLATLFAVAFLLVTVSLFVQNRTLKQKDNDNASNSLTLQGKIENLQEESRVLRSELASHLLEDAQLAFDVKDEERFVEVMTQLEHYADALGSEEQSQYEALKGELPKDAE